MKITKIRLQGVKSFNTPEEWAGIDPSTNILVGPNAGGKSNVLELVQGVFTTAVFRSLEIQKGGGNESAFKLVLHGAPRTTDPNAMSRLFDRPTQGTDLPQEVALELKIEQSDIDNLETIRRNMGALESFEQEQTGKVDLMNEVRRTIEICPDYTNLIDKSFEVRIEDQILTTPSNREYERYDGFFAFLEVSSALQAFLEALYNPVQDEPINFRPYFTYLSASRVPIGISGVPEEIILSSLGNFENLVHKQFGATAENQPSHWDALRNRLVFNHHLKKHDRNEPLLRRLREELRLTFTITQRRTYDNAYTLQFHRVGDGLSPKLSSGERELLNIITLFFVQEPAGGIIAIDEPELHLHPSWQRRFMKLIASLSEETGTQFFFVTHSPTLIQPETVPNVARVYKDNDGASHIVKPTPEELAGGVTDVHNIVNTLQNEKIYFAHRAVLVEGFADKVLVERCNKVLTPGQVEGVTEVVDVGGKGNLEKFAKYLNTFKIENVTLADLDYLNTAGSDEVKALFVPSIENLAKRVKQKGLNADVANLLTEIDQLMQQEQQSYSAEELKPLRDIWAYLLQRKSKLKNDLSDEEKALLASAISDLKTRGVYVIPEGSIEDIFGHSGHFDSESAVARALDIKTREDVPQLIKEILVG